MTERPPGVHIPPAIRRMLEGIMTEGDAQLRLPLAVLLLIIATGGLIDLVLDAPTTWRSWHVVYEVVLIAGALGAATWLWLGWRNAERRNLELSRAVAERQAERDAWRASATDALAGLAVAIEQQLDRWQLTPAERNVVRLLLKGRSHKEIAAEANRSERTVRQHAVAAYRKAGLSGRAELAAFFLRDLPLSVTSVSDP